MILTANKDWFDADMSAFLGESGVDFHLELSRVFHREVSHL